MAEIGNEKESVDLDPIVNSYDIYIKPQIPDDKKLYALQFPNRSAEEDYSVSNNSKPIALRVKPEAGLFELDVPIDIEVSTYDREKGVKWGDALKQANATKGGTTYGLPGGFGIGASVGGATRGRGRAVKDEPEDLTGMSRERWNKMLKDQRVMMHQTLGGQVIPVDSCSPTYYCGAFRNSTCYQLQMNDWSQKKS